MLTLLPKYISLWRQVFWIKLKAIMRAVPWITVLEMLLLATFIFITSGRVFPETRDKFWIVMRCVARMVGALIVVLAFALVVLIGSGLFSMYHSAALYSPSRRHSVQISASRWKDGGTSIVEIRSRAFLDDTNLAYYSNNYDPQLIQVRWLDDAHLLVRYGATFIHPEIAHHCKANVAGIQVTCEPY